MLRPTTRKISQARIHSAIRAPAPQRAPRGMLSMKTPDGSGVYVCAESGLRYREVEPGTLRCLDLAEDAALPDALRIGKISYDEFVHGSRHA